jgi:2-polyprenyl-6-hydroxyphenyl methylase / 3-demethylubiquinone-9 3-methyltransferase
MAATHPDAPLPSRDATLDAGEVRRFGDLATEWWDPAGKFRPLHKLGPARLAFIRQEIVRSFARPPGGLRPFQGLSVLDIGCGGGLVSEPVARLGAAVTGIDPAPENIAAAGAHASSQGMAIDYRACRVEDLVSEGRTFDGVLCLEVVEHVPDVAAFLTECAKLVRPGGLMVLSTINRTVKAYALAIVGAEYILRWLPVGTHQWERFVTPDELTRHTAAAGLAVSHREGLVYNPLTDAWSLSPDLDVNYMASAGRPA